MGTDCEGNIGFPVGPIKGLPESVVPRPAFADPVPQAAGASCCATISYVGLGRKWFASVLALHVHEGAAVGLGELLQEFGVDARVAHSNYVDP